MPGVNRQYRWPRLLAKLFDLKGTAPDLQVLDDVMPVAPLYDPTDTEHHFGRNEVLWSRGFIIAAGGAGTYFRLEVTTRPGYITCVEGVALCSPATARSVYFGITGAPLTGTANLSGRALDSRFEFVAAPGVQMYGAAVAVAPSGEVGFFTAPANAMTFCPVGVVIDKDDVFYITAFQANEQWTGTIFGYDRPIEESESG